MTERRIADFEKEIRGEWIVKGGEVQADDNCRRIEELTEGYLTFVASDSSGWAKVYVDPEDGRHWELTHPKSGFHGGGPPLLKHLSKEEAFAKYGDTH